MACKLTTLNYNFKHKLDSAVESSGLSLQKTLGDDFLSADKPDTNDKSEVLRKVYSEKKISPFPTQVYYGNRVLSRQG